MIENEDSTDPLEIDSESLRAAEFMQAQMILDTMVGKSIVRADVEDTRIAVTTADGTTYFFYGFMGEHISEDTEE